MKVEYQNPPPPAKVVVMTMSQEEAQVIRVLVGEYRFACADRFNFPRPLVENVHVAISAVVARTHW